MILRVKVQTLSPTDPTYATSTIGAGARAPSPPLRKDVELHSHGCMLMACIIDWRRMTGLNGGPWLNAESEKAEPVSVDIYFDMQTVTCFH